MAWPDVRAYPETIVTAGSSPMPNGYAALTEKEKEALRLIVRGHDAKSAASELSLSVHTINERLRAARRKLEVTSSREAARLVLEREGDDPKYLGSENLGEARSQSSADDEEIAAGTSARRPINAGVLIMLTFAAAALLLAPSLVQNDQTGRIEQSSSTTDAQVENAARAWLEVGDKGDWQAAFDAAGKPFRDVNTVAGFAEASRQVRVPLGAVLTREVSTVRYLNAPPYGFQEIVFSSSFANRADVLETVTLQKENGEWKVVGILID